MTAFALAAEAVAWWLIACAVATAWYCRLAVVARRTAARPHPAPCDEPPPRYTAEEIDLVRDLPLSAWQEAVDAHRLMQHVTTDADVMALLDGVR